ncbi:MAG: glycosyltransferase family 4 protein [Woeseiaceae bacterium]|nr:glycosyltransferase family 4 protein [Woeseiaceae bacterium]
MQPICHLNLAPGYRGGERQTELLIRELAARGTPQRLVARRGGPLAEHCGDVEGLEIREVAPNPVAAGMAVRGSAVAHSHEGRTVYSGLLANSLFGTGYVITRRVVAPQSPSWVRSLAYRRAAKIAAVSRAAAETLQVRHPELDPVVVPDAHASFDVDTDAVARIRAARSGKTLIGHVGAYDHSHKGQSTLIDAARIAADRFPDWHFLLCGEGKDEERFRAEIGGLQNIELVGWVENVGDWLAAFDLFVYPSLHEALGSSLLDAMGLGLPIVASNVGGIPEFVEDGVNGRLIKPADARLLAEAIAEVLERADDALRDANRAEAAKHGAATMANAYETLYREIAAGM